MRATVLAPGRAAGTALVLSAPISLWGGLDAGTGEIIEPRHPQRGAVLTGRILVMPAVRGSSSSASVLAEAVRAGTAPAGILLGEPDLVLPVGAEVAAELYGVRIPVGLLPPGELAMIEDGSIVEILTDGEVRLA